MSRYLHHQIPLAVIISALSFGHLTLADDDPEVHVDGRGDAVIRLTDFGGDGFIDPQTMPPDLIDITMGGWLCSDPIGNPFAGRWDDPDDYQVMRVDLRFAGLVNPPGPIGLTGPEYAPLLYGPSPLYGFFEFDVDEEEDTGGEVDGVAYRILGNASRFGGSLRRDLRHRAAVTADDLDGDLLTPPYVERSGAEFTLSLCGCQRILSINTFEDPTPQTFDPGDRWVIRGRFFVRSHAFAEYSFVFGGSQPGEYDPIVDLQYAHHTSTDETTVSLVFGLTNLGAARLRGESKQPVNGNVADQVSILEAIDDLRFSALTTWDPGPGTPFDLLRDWGDDKHRDLEDFLDPTEWNVSALVGTAYATEQSDGARYVWTDVGPDFRFGDVNLDAVVNIGDQNEIFTWIQMFDGSAIDDDGIENGQVYAAFFAEDFALFDLDYDGGINTLDARPIGYDLPGDIYPDRNVNRKDAMMMRNMFGAHLGDPAYNPAGDLNNDGVINRDDAIIMRSLLR